MFRAFAREVARAEAGFVVIDTAPTGNTLLLLDAAEAYHQHVLLEEYKNYLEAKDRAGDRR